MSARSRSQSVVKSSRVYNDTRQSRIVVRAKSDGYLRKTRPIVLSSSVVPRVHSRREFSSSSLRTNPPLGFVLRLGDLLRGSERESLLPRGIYSFRPNISVMRSVIKSSAHEDLVFCVSRDIYIYVASRKLLTQFTLAARTKLCYRR